MVSQGDIIKKFQITGGKGISDYWRRDISPIESKELANLLQAIRKIACHIGPNVGNIIWTGMNSSSEASDIALDPRLVMGKYPVPSSKTDFAIGTVVNNALKQTEWSSRVINLTHSRLAVAVHKTNHHLKEFLDMAEQIYIDIVSNQSVLGLYTEKVRQIKFRKARGLFVQPPSYEELMHIWWMMAADRSGCKYKEEFTDDMYGVYGYNLESHYRKPLSLLNSIIGELIEECPKKRSVVERCDYRTNIYVRIWEDLLGMTKFWMMNINDPNLLPKALDFDDILSDEFSEPLKTIRATLAREIKANLPRNNYDLTDEIRIICQDDEKIVPLEVNDIVLPVDERLDRELVYKLYLALKSHAKRRNDVNRGLTSGKIDGRRLYRAPTSGKVFCNKKKKYEMNSDIILLIDATGSMAGPKWKVMQKIFCALFTALSSFNKNCRLFAYYEVKGICNLAELTPRKGEFYTVLPRGKTASGEAIIATSLMSKRIKKPFIIHLTDGASNWGCPVSLAIDYCKKKKINLMTIGYGTNTSNKTALKEEYGDQVVFFENLKELPKKFAELLVQINYM
jgi:hypothetical protein